MIDVCAKCGLPPKIERLKPDWHIWCGNADCALNFVFSGLPKKAAIKMWEEFNISIYECEIESHAHSAALAKKLSDFMATHPNLK